MKAEDRKLILKWCGWYTEKHPRGWLMWYTPDKRYAGNEEPVLDLNFYFEYPVPKLRQELGENGLIEFLQDWVDEAVLHRAQRDEAEAFGQALLKLIKSGEWEK